MNIVSSPVGERPEYSRQQAMPRLGEILQREGVVGHDVLAEVMARQRATNRRLGDLLLARRAASGGAIAAALAEQWGLASADIDADPPDPALVRKDLAATYLAHRILPWQQGRGGPIHVTDHPEGATAALAALRAGGIAPGGLVIAPTAQLDAAFGRVLGAPLARRAATRTAEDASVRSLGPARAFAGLALIALAAGLWFGGSAALASALAVLLTINAATTVLRLFALGAGIWPPAPPPAAGNVTAAPMPVVTILVPLYREAGMVGEIAKALSAIDYPPELLDVKLLLEADDAETRVAVAAADLPGWISELVVPGGGPRTKPRALNYALDFARGEIVGILDAEDRPAPEQVRLVAETLRTAPPDVACAQCRLAYYNATENWITRCFQIEYAIWFDVLLTGFQRLGLPIPLGGTSVYFRRSALEELGAWDAHNVTEDADLGMRLARRGMRCTVLPSTTLEEANCRIGPWVRQRSRWLKGYLPMVWCRP